MTRGSKATITTADDAGTGMDAMKNHKIAVLDDYVIDLGVGPSPKHAARANKP